MTKTTLIPDFEFQGFTKVRGFSGKEKRDVIGMMLVGEYQFLAHLRRRLGDDRYRLEWLATPVVLWDVRTQDFEVTAHLARVGDDVLLAYVNLAEELVRVTPLLDFVIAEERSAEDVRRLLIGAAAFLGVLLPEQSFPGAETEQSGVTQLRLVAGRDIDAPGAEEVADEATPKRRISRKKARKAANTQ